MKTVTTIGLDIAKSVFQVHGVDTAGQLVIRCRFRRNWIKVKNRKHPAMSRARESAATVANKPNQVEHPPGPNTGEKQ